MTTPLAANVPNGSSTLSPKSPTSVFNALGSYADRIRDKEMKDNHVSTSVASSSKKSPSPPPTKDLPNASSSSAVASSSTSTSTTKPSKAANMAPPPAPKSAPVAKPGSTAEDKEKTSTKETTKEEEGAWETVPAGKSRRKERESIASTNWRERPKEDRPREKKDGSGWRGGDEEKPKGEGRKKGGAGQATTRSTSTHPSSSSAQTATPSAPTRSASVTPATTTRKAWGVITPSPSTIPIPSSTTPSAPAPRSIPSEATLNIKVTPVKPSLLARTTTPPSPSVTGASTAVNTSVTGDASPTISATAESTTTMVTPHGEKEDEEEDWRMRPRKLSSELVGKDIPSLDSPRSQEKPTKEKPAEVELVKENIQAAPPPPTNAWAERKKALSTQSTPATVPQPQFPSAESSGDVAKKAKTTTPSISSTMASKLGLPNKPAPLLFGSVEINESKALPNGEAKAGPSLAADEGVKIGSMKKKKSGAGSATRHVVDTNAFPDLAQAAAKVKKAEGAKQKESEDTPAVEETSGAPRKTKWTAIPATELLAAADEAKRHAQSVASKQKQQAHNSHVRAPSANIPTVPTLAESSSPTSKSSRKRTLARGTQSGSGSEIRLPSNGSARRGSSSTAGRSGGRVPKPVFGSINGETEASLQRTKSNQGSTINGLTSEPISRQSTNTSQISSPVRPITQLSSPKSPVAEVGDVAVSSMSEAAVQLGAESSIPNVSLPNGVHGATGSNTAPMPQSGFIPNGPPRSTRGARSSFSGGRGRGGFRGAYKNGGGVGMAHSMSAGTGDQTYRSGGSQGGFSTFVPQQQQHGAAGANGSGYDQAYGTYDYGMSMYGTPGGSQGRQALPMPPPPMPVTHATGLDALRFYVLGQVEYYFSMQNLAMDFFLRQQMDSEGWIDIAMITSFNRIKSLTPDPSIVKEVMLLSSLLEVRDYKVRLSYGESKRWILPDAKPSPYVDDGTNAISDDGGESGLGLSVGWGSIPINNGTEAEKKGLGLGMNGRDDLRVEVNKALMKSSPSITSVEVDSSKSDVTDTTDIQGVIIENGRDEKDKIHMGDEEKTVSSGGGSSVSEEAEKIELR